MCIQPLNCEIGSSTVGIKLKLARIISAVVLSAFALTQSSPAQDTQDQCKQRHDQSCHHQPGHHQSGHHPPTRSSQGATSILTVYCPGMANVTIDGNLTYTRGPVRQYALNFKTPHTITVDMTGKVGDKQKSVSRKVSLSSGKLNYIARFHPVPPEKKDEPKKQESKSKGECCNEATKTPPTEEESDALKKAKEAVARQKKKIDELRKKHTAALKNEQKLESELATLNSTEPGPTRTVGRLRRVGRLALELEFYY
jgi:hypothetical protein